MTYGMVRVLLSGQMVANTWETGKMENNTEKVSTQWLTVKLEKEYGNKVKESNGQIENRYSKSITIYISNKDS